jgi:two-component system, sensor histidine kinase and response regulator
MSSNTPEAIQTKCGRILVADDEPKNRELICDLLVAEGHTVIEATNGLEVLESANAEACDVILLDVMMPQMNGLAACRQLKQNPGTMHIPVLIVSALSDREQLLQGIDAGANDYLIKPINSKDVILRVRNAVYAKHLFDQVQENLTALHKLEALRDNLTSMIVHDLRSPLMGIAGYLEILELQAADKLDHDDLNILGNARSSASILMGMINSLLDVSRLEQGEMPLDMQMQDLDTVVQDALDSLGSVTDSVSFVYQKPSAPIMANCDASLVSRIIANLVGNAVKFTPEGGKVTLAMESNEAGVKLLVADTGYGIPPEHHQNIFEKFAQVELRKQHKMYSTGLGLTFCKLATEAQGGTIGVESKVNQGSTFWITLPRQG